MPAYNEGRQVGAVVAQTRQFLPVLVVDDGSKDDTAARAEAAGARVLRQTPNRGKGEALRAGFRWALEAGCEAVLTLDADGQHDPAEIHKFLAVWRDTQADLVIGERDFSQIPPVRRLANTLGRLSFSWAVGQKVRDNQSGYRLISRRLMESVLASQEAGFEFEVEMIVRAVRRGYRLEGVPIRTIYAGERSHIHPLKHILGFVQILLKTRLSLRD